MDGMAQAERVEREPVALSGQLHSAGESMTTFLMSMAATWMTIAAFWCVLGKFRESGAMAMLSIALLIAVSAWRFA
jgi:hypothetical protein